MDSKTEIEAQEYLEKFNIDRYEQINHGINGLELMFLYELLVDHAGSTQPTQSEAVEFYNWVFKNRVRLLREKWEKERSFTINSDEYYQKFKEDKLKDNG